MLRLALTLFYKGGIYNTNTNANTNTNTIAIETLGAWGKDAWELVSELGGRLAALSGDPRSLAFLRQRLGIAMQRGNAAAIRGTRPLDDSLALC